MEKKEVLELARKKKKAPWMNGKRRFRRKDSVLC